MRVGLEVKDSEVLLVPPHSSPLLRGGVRWLVTRQFQVVVVFCDASLYVCQVVKIHPGIQIPARSHLSTD